MYNVSEKLFQWIHFEQFVLFVEIIMDFYPFNHVKWLKTVTFMYKFYHNKIFLLENNLSKEYISMTHHVYLTNVRIFVQIRIQSFFEAVMICLD